MQEKDTILSEGTLELCPFQLFGLYMEIPRDWILYPENRSQEFRFQDGFVKFDHRGSVIKGKIRDSISAGLGWHPMEETISNEEFMERYVQRLGTPPARRFGKQGKNPIHIVESHRVWLGGQEAIFLECHYQASSKVFGGGITAVHALNVAFFDEKNHRSVVGTATAQSDTMEKYRRVLENVLLSIRNK